MYMMSAHLINVSNDINEKPIDQVKRDLSELIKEVDEIKRILKDLKDIITPTPIDELLEQIESFEPVSKGWFW
jgi:archaellum component FlaC